MIYCVCNALIFTENLVGQVSETENSLATHQLWVDFNPHFYVSEKFEYFGDAGYRTDLQNNLWNEIFARPSLRYRLNDLWELLGGIGFFYVLNKNISDRFEIRLWQGLQLNWPRFEKIRIKNLLRFEERFSYITDNWSSSTAFRVRYKLSGKWDFLKIHSHCFWYIPMYIEIFYPVGNEIEEVFRNRSRAGLGLGYNQSAEWSFAFNFILQTSRTSVNEELIVSDYVYQINIRKNIN